MNTYDLMIKTNHNLIIRGSLTDLQKCSIVGQFMSALVYSLKQFIIKHQKLIYSPLICMNLKLSAYFTFLHLITLM